MEVTAVADGREAWKGLEQSRPDVVLVDVSTPELSGYDLCERVKQDERFNRIPVILLVGLYEPFDEGRARRVGADDIVTKPFQSIRQLVGRVGALLGGKTEADTLPGAALDYSTLGLAHSDAPPTAPGDHVAPEANVQVFVEAASMTEPEAADSNQTNGSTCASDVELQTADTMQFERIDDERPAPIAAALADPQNDTAEMRPATHEGEDLPGESFPEEARQEGAVIMALNASEQPTQHVPPPTNPAALDESVLDLGDFGRPAQRAFGGDVILDLGDEEPPSEPPGYPGAKTPAPVAESAVTSDLSVRTEVIAPKITPAEMSWPEGATDAGLGESVIATPIEIGEPPVDTADAAAEAVAPSAEVDAVAGPPPTLGDGSLVLSPETIDMIARRTVAHLSEKVVREIAWEVVPELAELLIQRKLAEPE